MAEAVFEYRLQYQLRDRGGVHFLRYVYAYVQLVAEALLLDGEIAFKIVQLFSQGDSLISKVQAVTQYVSKRGRDGIDFRRILAQSHASDDLQRIYL